MGRALSDGIASLPPWAYIAGASVFVVGVVVWVIFCWDTIKEECGCTSRRRRRRLENNRATLILLDDKYKSKALHKENLLRMRLPGVKRRLLNVSAMPSTRIPTENPVIEPEASITETEAGSSTTLVLGALSGAVIYLGCVLRRFFTQKKKSKM